MLGEMRKHFKGIIIGIVLIIGLEVLAVTVFYYVKLKPLVEVREKDPGEVPPLEKLTRLTGTIELGDGNEIEIGKGEIIIINKWATWCGPCIAEMPSLAELHKQTKNHGVRMLCITREDIDLNKWKEKTKIDAPVYKQIKLPFDMKTEGIPDTWVIDGNGYVVFRHVGKANWSDQKVVDYLQTLAGWKP